MPDQSASWTGPWAAERLEKHSEVDKVELLSPQVLNIIRKRESSFLAGTIASPRVERSTIRELLNGPQKIEFIANIPQESFWTGEAIAFATGQSAAFGGFGDLFSAISLPNVNLYEKKEFSFVERGLCQHTRVTSLERVHDRKYVVKRRGLGDVDVLLLNEYELTADHVRTARDRYGTFMAILLTNPNGRVTSSAEEAAEALGARVYKWGEFLGQLNKQ